MPKPLTADEAKVLQLVGLRANRAGEPFSITQVAAEFEEAGGTFDEFAKAMSALVERRYLKNSPSPLFAALTLAGMMEVH